MKGNNNVAASGAAYGGGGDGRATVDGDDGDSVGGGATRTMSTLEIRGEPALLLL